MKKQIFTAVASLAVVAAMSISAFATEAGASNGAYTGKTEVKKDEKVEVTVTNENDVNIKIEADAGVFGEGELEINADVEQVNAEQVAYVEDAVKADTDADITVKSVDAVIDINALLDGVETKPSGDGNVTVTLPKAEGQTSDQVIYIDDKGNVEVLPTEVGDTTITFTTTHFSAFYLVTKATNGDTSGDNGEDKNEPTGVALVVVPAIAAAAAIVVSKKRK